MPPTDLLLSWRAHLRWGIKSHVGYSERSSARPDHGGQDLDLLDQNAVTGSASEGFWESINLAGSRQSFCNGLDWLVFESCFAKT